MCQRHFGSGSTLAKLFRKQPGYDGTLADIRYNQQPPPHFQLGNVQT